MQYGQYVASAVGFPELGTVAVIRSSDGCRRALGRFKDCLERQHEKTRDDEGVVEQAGADEQVRNEVDRADQVNEGSEHHKLGLQGDNKVLGHALLTPRAGSGFRNWNLKRPIGCKLGETQGGFHTT